MWHIGLIEAPASPSDEPGEHVPADDSEVDGEAGTDSGAAVDAEPSVDKEPPVDTDETDPPMVELVPAALKALDSEAGAAHVASRWARSPRSPRPTARRRADTYLCLARQGVIVAHDTPMPEVLGGVMEPIPAHDRARANATATLTPPKTAPGAR